MRIPSIRTCALVRTLPLALVFCPLGHAMAAAVYLTTTTGAIFQYDSVADMAAQTNTVSSGTLITTIAAYGSDQATTMDLSNETVYRVTGTGDVVSYGTLSAYLSNTGGITVGAGIYAGNDALNGLSYDGATGGFYAIGGGGATNNAQGDLIRWANLADFLANSNRTVTVAGFNGNLFNFYDPDGTAGTTFGNPPTFPATDRTTRYYQVSGAGRLEGWESLDQYVAAGTTQGDKRVHYTPDNVYGGTSTAFGPNTVDAATAFAVPEPGSVSLGLAGVLLLVRRGRRNVAPSVP